MMPWRIVLIGLVIIALAGSTACNLLGGNSQQETSQQLIEVTRGDLTVVVSGSGNIGISEEARLAFGAGGIVNKIYIEEGDEVSEDEVLAEIDTTALELTLTQAEVARFQAEVAMTQAKVNSAQAKVAEAQAKAAIDQAEYEIRNLTSLHEPVDRINAARSQLEAAKQQLEAVEPQLKLSEQQLEEAVLQLRAAELAVVKATKELGGASITAPFEGVVASVGANEGDTVPATQTIVHIIAPAVMELKAGVDEIDIPNVGLGQRAIVNIDALPDLKLEGSVASVSILPTARTEIVEYGVTISFDVPEGMEVKVGMSATVDIIINERSGVLLIPNRAIEGDSSGNPVVKVMVNDQVQERPVVLGISDGLQTEIVDGLYEGETLVIEIKAKPQQTAPGIFG